MPNVQLNVWIDKKYKDQLEQWKQDENKPGMNIIVEELIEAEIARRNGEIIEQNSLPAIQEIVRGEIQKAAAQLRRDLRQDREIEQTAQRDYLRKGFDRIAGLVIHAIRNSGFAQRFGYATLAKAYGPSFAMGIYEDSKERIERQLSPRKEQDVEQQEA